MAVVLLLLSSIAFGGEAGGQGIAAAPEELAKLLVLKIEDDHLTLDRDAWTARKEEPKKDDDDANNGANNGGPAQIQIQGAGVVAVQAIRMQMGRGNMPEPAKLFQQYMQKVNPRTFGNSMSSSNTRYEIRQQGEINGAFAVDTTQNEFSLKLSEKNEPSRALQFEEDPATGLTIRLVQSSAKQLLLFVQSPHGTVSLTSVRGDEVVSVSARDFTELLKKHPTEVQMLLFRPLREFGPREPLSPWLPPIMALACTGFGPPSAEIVKQSDALIAQLSNDDPETREKATQALIQLYPQAVQYLAQAREKLTDAEAKMRMERVVAAHPTIVRARAFVEEKKLHEDKAYLKEILGGVPFFKAAARQRLTQLYGQDHGDDPKAWP
jgi:hypothetical protein